MKFYEFYIDKNNCPVVVSETAEVPEDLGYEDIRFKASSTVTGRWNI